jgi:hypothetical protein
VTRTAKLRAKTTILGQTDTTLFTRELMHCGSPRRLRWVYAVRFGRSAIHPTTGHHCTPVYYGGCAFFPVDVRSTSAPYAVKPDPTAEPRARALFVEAKG